MVKDVVNLLGCVVFGYNYVFPNTLGYLHIFKQWIDTGIPLLNQ